MFTVYLLLQLAVLAIGIFMVAKHHKNGWATPPVLSGIAFILISLPSLLAMIGLY